MGNLPPTPRVFGHPGGKRPSNCSMFFYSGPLRSLPAPLHKLFEASAFGVALSASTTKLGVGSIWPKLLVGLTFFRIDERAAPPVN